MADHVKETGSTGDENVILFCIKLYYHQTSNICRTLVYNQIVVHSDVVWASLVGAAPTTSSFSI